MNDHHDIHELLESAAPHDTGLSTAERSRQVVARGRAARRRARIGVAGGAAVIVIAAAVATVSLGLGADRDRDVVADRPTTRIRTTSGVMPPVPTCPAPVQGLRSLVAASDTYDGELSDLDPVAGTVCYGPDSLGGLEYQSVKGRLAPPALGRVLADAIATRTTAPKLGCTDSGPVRLIVLVDADGRRLTLSDDSCSGIFRYGGDHYWKPGADAERVITRALGGRARDQQSRVD